MYVTYGKLSNGLEDHSIYALEHIESNVKLKEIHQVQIALKPMIKENNRSIDSKEENNQ